MRPILLVQFTIAGLCAFKPTKTYCQLTRSPLDTTISVFNNCKLTVSIYDTEKINDYDGAKNATVSYVRYQNGKSTSIFSDSIFCNGLSLKLEDFNNDGVKDILVFYDYDVRSNEMYYLYLVDSRTKKLMQIKNFRDIKNPVYNHKKNIIESHVISGRNYFTYYKIGRNNKLIDYKKVIYE